jgi:hypothetical protein
MIAAMMNSRIASYCLAGLLTAAAAGASLTGAQQQFVDPKVARECGCTLREWPLLQTFLTKTAPSLAAFQPEVFLPHYTDAGCGNSPRLPPGGVYGEVRYSNLATLDLFINHDWHDFTFFVKLDGDAYYLNSATNAKNANSFLCYNLDDKSCPAVKGEMLMEIEWDIKHYPEKFWATAGDHVWMTGRYVWDCGHPPAYHTEIHPPKALALTRHEPYLFPGDASPSLTNTTYVYVHGRSGVKNYDFKTVAGIESVVFNGYKDSPVAVQDYEFVIPLPPKPANYAGPPIAKVIDLPFGGPSPILAIDQTQKSVRVKYPLNLGDPSPDRKFGAVIVAGWRAPVPDLKFRRLIVNVEQLQILKRHNAVSSSDWKLWLNVNGQWIRIEDAPTSESAVPLGLDRLLNIDGLLGSKIPPVRINKAFEVIVPDTEQGRLTIQVAGWVNFYDELFGSREDVLSSALRLPSMLPQTLSVASSFEGRLGQFFKQFSRQENFGIGAHNRTQTGYTGELSKSHELVAGTLKNQSETQGDFALSYSIREVPTGGSRAPVIGSP